MHKFNHIYWDPKFTVHNESIDRQHQELFRITNNLIDEYEKGSMQCYDTIKELVDYLWEHFRVEQQLMMELNYPSFTTHMEQHKKFMDQVESFLQDHRNGAENLSQNLISFLVNWVSTHTTTLDLQYGEYWLKSQSRKNK